MCFLVKVINITCTPIIGCGNAYGCSVSACGRASEVLEHSHPCSSPSSVGSTFVVDIDDVPSGAGVSQSGCSHRLSVFLYRTLYVVATILGSSFLRCCELYRLWRVTQRLSQRTRNARRQTQLMRLSLSVCRNRREACAGPVIIVKKI